MLPAQAGDRPAARSSVVPCCIHGTDAKRSHAGKISAVPHNLHRSIAAARNAVRARSLRTGHHLDGGRNVPHTGQSGPTEALRGHRVIPRASGGPVKVFHLDAVALIDAPTL